MGSLSVILVREEVTRMSQPEINFCKTQHMSICSADSRLHQEDCSFYEKSINANRCMYFVFEEYCDCLNAQMNAQNSISS
jgi:hypothetical protein